MFVFSMLFYWYHSGLDPASYGFPLESPETSLDKSDGVFVDVIHTEITHYAYITHVGHAGFHPNGGLATQPGCSILDSGGQHFFNIFLFIKIIAVTTAVLRVSMKSPSSRL